MACQEQLQIHFRWGPTGRAAKHGRQDRLAFKPDVDAAGGCERDSRAARYSAALFCCDLVSWGLGLYVSNIAAFSFCFDGNEAPRIGSN